MKQDSPIREGFQAIHENVSGTTFQSPEFTYPVWFHLE